MEILELSEIQGFLIREYKELPFSKYFLLKVGDAAKARKFVGSIASQITSVTTEIKDTAFNIGFTSKGLLALGLLEENLGSFIKEFREGMVTPHRQRLLGDFDNSDPAHWNWGGTDTEPVDFILLFFAKDELTYQGETKKMSDNFAINGLHEILQLEGKTLPNNREHFGFKDGISQPAIIGSGITGINNDNIKPGEFILGYKNEYNVLPDAPMLVKNQGDFPMLPDDPAGSHKKDLGKNGTYFVLRQLKEDVAGFWSFLNEQTKHKNGMPDPAASTKLAAKMMGRWPGGAPLVKYPDTEPEGDSSDNDFFYVDEDKHGLKCPFGAHTRRTNPRDQFEETGPKESLKLTRRHRIMRRVRSYGEDFTGSATRYNPTGEVGLLFGCFVADISRQFEFIQYTWANYPKFKQLYNDPDPFIGVKENPEPGTVQNFTIPQPTVNKYITGLKRFVDVKGGGYFFFPSVTVVRFFGTLYQES